MGNCLITKLKAEVNNDNLPTMDTIRLTVNHDVADRIQQAERNFTIKAQDANIVTLKNEGGRFQTEEGTDLGNTILMDSAEHTYFYTSTTNRILIKNKAGVRELQCYTAGANVNALLINMEDAKYMTTITSFICGGLGQTGKASDIPISSDMRRLRLNNCSIIGTLEDVRDTNVTELWFIGSNLTGDVESLIHRSDGSLRPAGTINLIVGYQKVKYKGEYINVIQHTVVFDGLGGVTVDGV